MEFEFLSDWPHWEMHPKGDEFVYLLNGSLDMLMEYPDSTQTIKLDEGKAYIIPKGIWHRAMVYSPSRMLHITLGEGTEHREI